ncbi:hypothetical protein GLOTRDRAFT_96985 [Gloeophyllum trabeum ATCC 11539]|uniref:Uncharacterized protein n=1 Tax=Gloeophyllum trabeum (strain ATCC 11539 / FP-39264 / Madison 617) TaxID=670483 RepID=S7R853_GLOTA|nr:uncharacterized protein GLOTRDRAFT_96985 [Gloeophyllum trabeum ATCC 11539]EPQ50505.1 hypothetical protein GLOTRDRAFT_96985 [Gloeophyllum trabeum ATCC 11539]
MTTYPTPISQTSPAYSQGATPSALSSPPTSPDQFLPGSTASMRSTRQAITEGLIFGDIAGEVISPADGFDVCLQEGGALEDLNPAAYVGLGEAVFEGGAEVLGTLTEPMYTSHQRFLGGMTSGGASTMDGYNIHLENEAAWAEGYNAPVESGVVSMVNACYIPLANGLGGTDSAAYTWLQERGGQGQNTLQGTAAHIPLADGSAVTNQYEMPVEGWPNANGAHLSTQAWSGETLYPGGNMLAQTGPTTSKWSSLTSSGPYVYTPIVQTLYRGVKQIETAGEVSMSATVVSDPPEPLRMIRGWIDGPNMSVRQLTEITHSRGGKDPWCDWKGRKIKLPRCPEGYSCILKFKYGNYRLPTSKMTFETGILSRRDIAVQLALKFLEGHSHLMYDRLRRCQQAGHQHDPCKNCDLGGPPESLQDIILTRIEQKGNQFRGIFENRDGSYSVYPLES